MPCEQGKSYLVLVLGMSVVKSMQITVGKSVRIQGPTFEEHDVIGMQKVSGNVQGPVHGSKHESATRRS